MIHTRSFSVAVRSLVSITSLLSCLSFTACGSSSQPGDQDAEVRSLSLIEQHEGNGLTVELRFQPDSIDVGTPTYSGPNYNPSIPISLGATVTLRLIGELEYIEGSSSVNGMPLGDPVRFPCENGATVLSYYIDSDTAAPLQTSSLLFSLIEQGSGTSSVQASTDPFFGCDSDSEDAETLIFPG